MAENTNPSRIKEVRILGDDGTPVGEKVKISPDAADVMVHDASEQTTNNASLQDFLFRKFLTKDTNAGQMRANNEEDPYFQVDPTRQSVWQGWHDYQDIIKKRLAGIYADDGYQNADFLLDQESDIQAKYTLTNPDVNSNDNIKQVIEQYPEVQDKKIETEGGTEEVYSDYRIPNEVQYDEGNIVWEELTENQKYTQEDKARELMFSFGKKSFWQAIIDRELENKDKLIGIYNKDGECVGHFEATRYNLEALKEVYSNGIAVAVRNGFDEDGNEITQELVYGEIKTDKDAMDLIVDTSKKSIYQQLIDLKDFWITLPFEVYEKGSEQGLNIVNKYDIQQLHFNPQVE